MARRRTAGRGGGHGRCCGGSGLTRAGGTGSNVGARATGFTPMVPWGCGAGRGQRGKLAGPPKFHEVVEAGELADQGGADEGVQRRQRAPLGGVTGGIGAQVG